MEENAEDKLTLEFQKDNFGTKGDVRDIVIRRNNIRWEIGLSIKHNHDAIKHSRLSHNLDFAKEWFDIPCTEQYWADVKPIFDRLKSEKRSGKKWSELPDKECGVYAPLLKAFIDEINRAYQSDSSIPGKMAEHLVGTGDYYKIISHDKQKITLIHTFNMHGSLKKSSCTKTSSIHVPIVKMPTELVAIRFKPGTHNTVEMYLNNGWQLSFRIHNASTKVEPSLKFDVRFLGMPVSVLHIECRWHGSG